MARERVAYLSTADVKRILTRSPVEVTGELLRVADLLLSEARARTDQIDTKANTSVGFAGVILALLVTLATDLETPPLQMQLSLLGAGILALAAGVLALLALNVREFVWFSDSVWFGEGILTNAVHENSPKLPRFEPDELMRRYFLIQAHDVVTSYNTANDQKAGFVDKAQLFLVLSAAALTGALGLVLFR